MPTREIGIRLAELSLKAIAMGVKNDEIPESLRFWWFKEGEIHYDAQRYATLRRISVEEAHAELRKFLGELLPGTPIIVQD